MVHLSFFIIPNLIFKQKNKIDKKNIFIKNY